MSLTLWFYGLKEIRVLLFQLEMTLFWQQFIHNSVKTYNILIKEKVESL